MSDSNQLASVLKGMVGESNVIQDPERLQAYAVDGSAPKAVVCPGNAAEISSLLLYANAGKLAVVPRGSGTKMAAGGVPPKIDLVLSTVRLDRIVDYDIANLSLTVEAGLTLADVQKRLAGEKKGNFLPLDPPYSEKATIGGVIAANASGPKRYIYGSARDLLLGLKAVTPMGDIVSFGGKTVKNVSGYDMTKLLIGSWGGAGRHNRNHDETPAASGGVGDGADILRKAGGGWPVHPEDHPFHPVALRRGTARK
jgi:glycolate oxidase FAD binding subunit